MTIKLAVDGRGAHMKRLIDQLVARSGGSITTAVHFGDRDSDFHSACLARMEVRYGRKGHLIQRHVATGANLSLLAMPDFAYMLEQATEQLHRFSPNYRYRSHNLTHVQDYIDYYHILADAYAQEIEETGATHALFFSIPHIGHDVILYQVVRAMGLKVLIVSQTFDLENFVSLERVEDFGHVNPDAAKGEPIRIEKGSAPDLYYMQDRWQKESPRGRINSRVLLSLLKHVALKRPGKLISPDYILGNLRRIKAIYGGLPDWRDPFAKFFHQNELAYFEHLAEYEGQPVDLDVPFVYMPLHNQPEMSTQSLGGMFRDQLLSVEAIASVLPDGWRIYVKENPRQGGYARGPMFFHRLSRIKGVQFVPSTTSTHELSARAQITATVTGTAGWEALRKGRPVVVFGYGWWRDFPGAYPWSPGMDLQAVAASTFPHEALEQAYGNLIAACHPGLLERNFQNATPDLDVEANTERLCTTIQALLEGTMPLTFAAKP